MNGLFYNFLVSRTRKSLDRFLKKLFLYFVIIFISTQIFADTYVNGYYKKDGTYVEGHYKTNPNKTNYFTFELKQADNRLTSISNCIAYREFQVSLLAQG